MSNFLGPIIPNLLIHYTCNPDNLKFEYNAHDNEIDVLPVVSRRVPFMLQVLSTYYGVLGIIGSLMISAPKRTLRRDMLFMKMEQKVSAHKRFYASDAVGIFIARDIQQETKQNIKDYYNTAMKIKKYVNRLELENR